MLLGLVGLALLAGCLSLTVEVTVQDDGNIERMETTMELDPFLHQALVEQAQNEGYESLEESLTEDMETEAWEDIRYDEEETDDAVVVTITALNGDPAELETIDVTVEEDSITFVEEEGFGDDEFGGGDLSDEELQQFLEQIEMAYIVNMPGDITDTNGEIREDGQSVEWTLANHTSVTTFEATSERADASAIPGFGVAVAVVALVGVALAAIARRRR